MLKFIKISNPDITFSLLDQFVSDQHTWIVSDLKSKTEIQQKLIHQQGFFLENSILRVSDFWRIWLRRLAPDFQVVSGDFIKSMVEVFIENYGNSLEIEKNESTTLYSYITELAPMLLNADAEAILSEWFLSKADGTNKKWYRWFLLSKLAIKYLVDENKTLEAKWVASYLQRLDLSQMVWPNSLIVDLGSEMTSTEMGLLKTIAKNKDITIIQPDPSWKDKFPHLLKTYADHEGYAQKVEVLQGKGSDNLKKEIDFVRVSTQLSEVKMAVGEVRRWLDKGVEAKDIAIVSADIEHYWSTLSFYLRQEGVPANKDQVTSLASLDVFQVLNAYLKNYQSEVSWESLETSLFARQEESLINFEQFKSLFYLLIDEDDLDRDQSIKSLFYRKINLKQNLDRNDFLSLIIKIWIDADLISKDPESIYFKIFFRDLISNAMNFKMSLGLWIRYAKQRLRSKEVRTRPANAVGVQVLPLMSAHISLAKYLVYIGLDERTLSHSKKTLIPQEDAYELKRNFDFNVQIPEESFYDFNMRWQQEKYASEIIYICAHTSFDSTPLTSSIFFLENLQNKEIQDPKPIRFDEIQNDLSYQYFDQGLEVASLSFTDKNNLSLEGLTKDIELVPNVLNQAKIFELSATDLEEYFNCEFKLLARKGFRLREFPYVGLDLDPRHKGTLTHNLFEFLIQDQKKGQTPTTDEIEKKLEELRRELKLYQTEQQVWGVQKKRFVKISEKFLQFENERKFLKNLDTEKDFKIYFDLKQKKFMKVRAGDQGENKDIFSIKGRIDRVDRFITDSFNDNGNKNELVIFDYKSSTQTLSNYSKFLENGELQLLLYAVACETVLYSDSSVVASLYYDSKLFQTGKGLVLDEKSQQLHPSSRKIGSQLSVEEKAILFNEFIDLTFDLLTKLDNKNFRAIPKDEKLCKTCDWSRMCRAPHLMY